MPAVSPTKYLVMAGWDDTPHMDEKTKRELLEATPVHLRMARSKGIPIPGSGLIFPIDESTITVDPFPIPAHWPRLVGWDFGWDHPSAGAWLAWDRDTDTVYLYDHHRESEINVGQHADAIKSRGAWIPVAWPHDGLQHEKGSGIQLSQQFREKGVKFLQHWAQFIESGMDHETVAAKTSVEAGLSMMLTRMKEGRFKVFSTVSPFFEEMRLYHRKDGKIVKVRDDLISACLHPETRVITRTGATRIAELVGTSGEVLSAGGEWAQYHSCRKTRIDAALVRVTFDDGYELLCTPDHKLLSASGEWVQAVDATGLLCHNAVSHSGNGKWTKSPITGSVSRASGTTSVAHENSCIVQFGRMLTAQFQRAITSTIKTMIEETTRLRTLSLCVEWSTCLGITRGMGAAPTQLSSLSLNGARLMLVKHSIMRWGRGTHTSSDRRRNSFANAAVANSQHNHMAKTGSAQTHAEPSNGVVMAPTECRPLARFASPSISPAGSSQAKHARAAAVASSGSPLPPAKSISRVLQVRADGRSDVYCMEVPRYHALAVENGVVVHNCRYGLMSLRWAIVEPKEESEAESKPRSWRVI